MLNTIPLALLLWWGIYELAANRKHFHLPMAMASAPVIGNSRPRLTVPCARRAHMLCLTHLSTVLHQAVTPSTGSARACR